MKNKKNYVKNMVRNIFLFLLCSFASLSVASALQNSPTQLTKDRVVKVGYFPLNGFFNVNPNGSVSGYGIDYTDELMKFTGWNYEYVYFSSWNEALSALESAKIDLLAPAQRTADRESRFSFDFFPIGTEYGSLLALSTNDSLIYEDFEGFNNLNVGIVPSLIFRDDFETYQVNNNFKVNLVFYKDTAALVAALNAGEIEAIVANQMVMTKTMKLLGTFGTGSIYYMMTKHSAFVAEVDRGIDALSSKHPLFQSQLNQRYFNDFNRIPFSRTELDFINQSEPLNIACLNGFMPFSYIDPETQNINGVVTGIFERISQISGLKFNYVPMPVGGSSPKFLSDYKIDLISGVENDKSETLYGDSFFTEPYLILSKFFIGLTNSQIDFNKHSKVATIFAKDAALENLKTTYPNFEFVRYMSPTECVNALHTGEVQLILSDRYSIERLMPSSRNQDIKIFPGEAIASEISAKVLTTSDYAQAEILCSIINKSIKLISNFEVETIINEFATATRYKYTVVDFFFQYRVVIFFVLGLFILGILCTLFIAHTKQKAADLVKENELRLSNITNNINGGVIVMIPNKGFKITFANDGFLALVGITREDFETVGHGSYLAYVHTQDMYKIQEALDLAQTKFSIELRILKSDKSYIPALFNCTVGHKLQGEVELYCVIMDLTKQNSLIEQLRVENRRTELILSRVEEIFYEVNIQDKTITTSSSFMEQLGWTLPEKIQAFESEELERMWHMVEGDAPKLVSSTRQMLKRKEAVSTVVRLESNILNRYIWAEVFQHPILSSKNEVISVIGFIRNVDEEIRERERLIEQAQHDPLTGLLNKDAFEKLVDESLKALPDQNHALVFIDLDHFKNLNDSLGHLIGDRAICDAADKLRLIFSQYDLISRFGGDEFCILVKNIPQDTIHSKMDWLCEKIHQDYTNDETTVSITCSCGVACTENVGFSYESLMKSADEALYYSKDNGRNKYTFYKDIAESEKKDNNV